MTKQNWDRSSYKAILAIKPLYNIYNVPGVYYCDKYEIIVYMQYAYYTYYIQYTVSLDNKIWAIHLIYTHPYGREFLRGVEKLKLFLRGCVRRHPLIFAFFLRGKAKIS